jgi:hypothetical protein
MSHIAYVLWDKARATDGHLYKHKNDYYCMHPGSALKFKIDSKHIFQNEIIA